MDRVSQGCFDRLLVSADAKYRPLDCSGVKGHPLNVSVGGMLLDLRTAGLTATQAQAVCQDPPAEVLSMTQEGPR